MKGPSALVQHLRTELYHPRSAAHSNAICLGILEDLLDHCEPFARRAVRGELVAKLNHTVIVEHERWNIDLAIGPPATAPTAPAAGTRIRIAPPAVVEIAVEAKGVMTEHGKARLNRLRDFRAFHSHAHLYNPKVVAVAVVVVNVADVFWSPTRAADDVTRHRNVDRLGRETVEIFRSLPLRNSASDGPGLEAMCAVVVRHDNILKNIALPPDAPAPQRTTLVDWPPAPRKATRCTTRP
jgi:hypothetical protein